jgi:hypothetical protein
MIDTVKTIKIKLHKITLNYIKKTYNNLYNLNKIDLIFKKNEVDEINNFLDTIKKIKDDLDEDRGLGSITYNILFYIYESIVKALLYKYDYINFITIEEIE